MTHRPASLFFLATVLSATACSIDISNVFESSGVSGGGGAGGSGTTTTGGGPTGGTTGTTGTTGSTGTTGTTSSLSTGGGGAFPCDPASPGDPNADADGDGWSANEGDCNDCDAAVNPGAVDVPGNGKDDNCDAKIDEPLATCDDNVAMDSQDPMAFLKAAELCKVSGGVKSWGVITATWALADGSAPPQQSLQNFHLGHGVLPDFGPNVLPRAGKKILALSSGTARRPNDPGFQSLQGFNKGYSNASAPGFPKESPSCPAVESGGANDATAVEALVRVPSNAHGFSYDFNFYAYDFPQFVCSVFDDFFFSVLLPSPAGSPDGVLSYDELGGPVSLNGANFRVCGCQNGPPCAAGNKMFTCPLGTGQLQGTGFGVGNGNMQDHGATGWLTTLVPVTPGSEVSIRWGVYDSGDGSFDSTVLIDNWRWITTPGVSTHTTIP